jgi:hypothetical protein
MTGKPAYRRQRPGQGVIEYAGALITAAMIVVALTTGMNEGNWMYNTYNTIYNSAGKLLVNTLEKGLNAGD